jgi:translation elongation factor EF-G
MATPSPGDLRNFAIVGHASSGKTTLSEAMLACAGVIGRMDNIAQGTTVSDYHVSEKQHQISTQTSLLHCTCSACPGRQFARSTIYRKRLTMHKFNCSKFSTSLLVPATGDAAVYTRD